MAEFIDISELDEKMSQNNYKLQASFHNQTDKNMVTDKIQQYDKAFNSPDEELAVLLQEKMQLDEMRNELEKTASNKLEENMEIIEKWEKQEKSLENKKHIAYLKQIILSKIYRLCKMFKTHIEGALDSKWNELRNNRMLCGSDKVAVEQTMSLAETMFSSFTEQFSKVEFMMKPDYYIICLEDENGIDIVYNEYNKLKESYNILLSMLFNV